MTRIYLAEETYYEADMVHFGGMREEGQQQQQQDRMSSQEYTLVPRLENLISMHGKHPRRHQNIKYPNCMLQMPCHPFCFPCHRYCGNMHPSSALQSLILGGISSQPSSWHVLYTSLKEEKQMATTTESSVIMVLTYDILWYLIR